jgi:NADH dehydrogenase
VVGAGFGGLRAVRALARAPVDITLIDRHNYHLFQPLLYQVATAGLEPESIARPVRAILRRQRNLQFRLAVVRGVDRIERTVLTDGGAIPYDYLILAAGGETNFFGRESVRRHGFDLKDLDDAIAVRNHVLLQFEAGVLEADADRRREALTFAVVGGGPTGVEMAGALAELIRLVLKKDYPALNLNDTRIVLLEAADQLLAAMPAALGAAAAETLWRKHVEVRFGAAVEDFDGRHVRLKTGEVIPARTLIWAAGVRAVTLADRLDLPTGPQGRIRVGPTLEVPDQPGVFAIGDVAFVEGFGGPLPMMAPVAIQMARTAAANVRHRLAGRPLEQFRYRDPGQLATIGRNAAVAAMRGLTFHGFTAWVVWLVVHIIQLIGFRNKLVVLLNWTWDYFAYERGSRLITAKGARVPDAAAVVAPPPPNP